MLVYNKAIMTIVGWVVVFAHLYLLYDLFSAKLKSCPFACPCPFYYYLNFSGFQDRQICYSILAAVPLVQSQLYINVETVIQCITHLSAPPHSTWNF